MAIQDILAAVLNPNGAWSLGGPENRARLAAASDPRVMAQGAPAMPQAVPQAPQAGIPQQAPQAAPQPSGGGIGGGIGDLLAGLFAPQSRGRNETVHWLTQQGYDPGTAQVIASDKGALRSVILGRGKGNDFSQRAAAAQQFGLDPNTPEGRNFILTGKLEGADDGTGDMKEYQFAKQQGFPGSFMDFQVKMREAGRNQVNIDTGTKLPTGFMWIDPADQGKGVKPIPGGPATQIPAEAAGRIGLADTFLKNFDGIKQKVLSGDITGPIDAFRARNDSQYGGAETFRQIQSGVDSLQRMLTGAGMPASEAANYAFRYLPTYTDDAQSMATKLDRLKSELEGVKQRVLQGRGGGQEGQTPPPASGADLSGDTPPQGWTGKPELWKYMTPEQRKLWQ